MVWFQSTISKILSLDRTFQDLFNDIKYPIFDKNFVIDVLGFSVILGFFGFLIGKVSVDVFEKIIIG